MVRTFSSTLASLFLLLFGAGLLAACGAPAITAQTPPTIHYGEDVCAECGMIISDERFAAGAVVEIGPNDYTHRIFDDIGGMVTYVADHPELTFANFYVHDYATQEWIDAHVATFLISEAIHSPMGHGILACRDRAEAEALSAQFPGQLSDFAQLQVVMTQSSAPAHQHSD